MQSGIDVEKIERVDDPDILLGDDWEEEERAIVSGEDDPHIQGGRSGLNRSPLARKIITFNLLALVVFLAGLLYINPIRDSLYEQRERTLIGDTQLIARVFEGQLPKFGPVDLKSRADFDMAESLSAADLPKGVQAFVFDTSEFLVGEVLGTGENHADEAVYPSGAGRPTFITDFLSSTWDLAARVLTPDNGVETGRVTNEDHTRSLLEAALVGDLESKAFRNEEGALLFTVAAPIQRNGVVMGAVALATHAEEIDQIIRVERELVLQIFACALLVSIALSLVLAGTISNPLSDLATAAEIGRGKNARKVSPHKVRIPDMSGRPDEIGRLSSAMRGMVSALYDRIEANEQFAADVAHEIKNPLSSLRSAVDTMRLAKKPEQRDKLMDVIEHDVRRLDRLVSDISNASRLDSELVREEMLPFNLTKMLDTLVSYQKMEAEDVGVDFITDLPTHEIEVHGLEGRLAQVFVNLMTNALSFCEDGDAIRVWVRKRENRVLIVVEDTGPGIPDEALTKVFSRFYSERPANDFGNHSGLGLAISKQIVEAHGGVIWAENIRPTSMDPHSDPLGARFVVGLPV